MTDLEAYLKPKTNGADRSPYSSKNLPKIKYIIPDEDLVLYKNITAKIPKEHILDITHSTNHLTDFINNYTAKEKNNNEN